MGDQIILATQSFFRSGRILSDLNETFIALIPKKNGSCNFNQFRLISLCNVCYKVISKIIVSRLRPLLSRMIDPTQVAFVPNKWITENVVIAQEVVHSFKKTKKKKGFLGIKIDFQKAYNRMEWNFFSLTLKAFGFSNKFTNLIHQCLSTMQYSVLLNGGKCPFFTPSRGLREGDPLSPYLFILLSEVLIRLISREVDRGQLTTIKVSSNAPPISKLCYADDVILFSKAKMFELSSLKICLEKYCSWSR